MYIVELTFTLYCPHQCGEGFWPQLFFMFGLGTISEAYLVEVKKDDLLVVIVN